VKSKARRNYYPDTGVDVRHYDDYMHIKETYTIPVFIYFVDEMLKLIYGGEIGWLTQPRTRFAIKANGWNTPYALVGLFTSRWKA